MKLIEQAEPNELSQFNVRRIEIVGNHTIRYRIYSEKFAFGEGDIFTKEALNNTIKGINELEEIHPINLENIKISRSKNSTGKRNWNFLDFTICVKEKEKNEYEKPVSSGVSR